MYLQIATYLFGFTQGWLCLDDTGCQKSTCYLGPYPGIMLKHRQRGEDEAMTLCGRAPQVARGCHH